MPSSRRRRVPKHRRREGRRGKRCKRLVLGNVEYDRYQEATHQVECAANNEINGVWHLPPKYRADHGDRTKYGRSEESAKEPTVQDNHIDRLHGRDPVTGGKTSERLHDER
jgi:hypothetical protein